ncbi:MAG: hypothetical protein RMK19_05490 [Bacteroidia bacterium]|nr:hypothetical protein [Bacteroidia bacterium]MDW8015447.1 hypothetical protein [Bacteroidia bacterium]
MVSSPSLSVLESYAKELQRTWLTGKVFPVWNLTHLRDHFPSEQVIQLILFQVESKALSAIHEVGYWDWKDGQMTAWLGEFFSKAQQRIAISHIHLSPLLHNAIYHSLRILLDPTSTWAQFYFGQRSALTIEEFSFYSRYVVYFDFISIALLSYARRNSLSVIDRSLWEEKAPRILSMYEEETQEKVEEYQRRHLEKMCQQSWDLIQKRWQILKEEGEDLIGSVVTKESSGSDELLQNLFGTFSGAGQTKGSEGRPQNPLLSAIDYEPRRVLREQFEVPVRRVETLRRFELDAIPIHKQFIYIQRVFDGDPTAFRQALDRLNEAASADEARALVQAWKTDKTDPQALIEFERWVLSRFQN